MTYRGLDVGVLAHAFRFGMTSTIIGCDVQALLHWLTHSGFLLGKYAQPTVLTHLYVYRNLVKLNAFIIFRPKMVRKLKKHGANVIKMPMQKALAFIISTLN